MISRQMIAPLFVSLCLISSSTQLGAATDVDYCDKKGYYDVKVSGVEITPNPVVRGQQATFRISANTTEAIAGGKLIIDVAYFGWHIYSETHDLCDETSCPVSTGDFLVSHSQVLPGYTPPGSYSLKMRMIDGNKNQLTCISFGFSIGLASHPSWIANFFQDFLSSHVHLLYTECDKNPYYLYLIGTLAFAHVHSKPTFS